MVVVTQPTATRILDVCAGMCVDMCMDMCMDICVDMRVDMRVDVRVDVCGKPTITFRRLSHRFSFKKVLGRQ